MRQVLELSTRTDRELQNISDMAVLFYERKETKWPLDAVRIKEQFHMINRVIDQERMDRNLPIGPTPYTA